jgi:transposase
MEATGNYHAPVAQMLHDAGLYVSVVNPKLVHGYGNNDLRCVKTDRKDAVKLANYGLDRWLTLPRYVPDEDTRLLLKNCYRQYRQYSKVQTMLKNNLISLLDTTFPNANRLFTSPPRVDGSEKWVDFVTDFWHCKCVSTLSKKAFTTKYRKWCKKHGYYFSEKKAHGIYTEASRHIGVLPMSDTTKLLVEQAVSQLRATSAALAALKQEMNTLAAQLPEYPIVMEMYGVGPALGPQLMAEIGDVRRFHSKKALVAYAGIDAPPNDSGDVTGRHRGMSKVGASSLRRTLFLVMSVYLQNAPIDEPVYRFMGKKRAEGKPYKVYMMASANKFLRIYYASVKAYLDNMDEG